MSRRALLRGGFLFSAATLTTLSNRFDNVAFGAPKKAGSKSLPNQLIDPYIIILA
jgi:hypothetical protein